MSEHSKAFDRVLFEKSPFRTSIWIFVAAGIGIGAASLLGAPMEIGTSPFILGAAFLLFVASVMASRGVNRAEWTLYAAVAFIVALAVMESFDAAIEVNDETAAYAAEARQAAQLRQDLEALCTQTGGANLDDRRCMNLQAVYANFGEAGRPEGGLSPRSIE